jgi:non-specific serine/threonine protein kinase/serine/threonine-protein kinase
MVLETHPSDDPASYAEVKAALFEALDLPPERVAVWLDQLAATRPDVAARVRQLFAAHQSAGSFMDSPAAGRGDPGLYAEPTPPAPGTRIGPFTVDGELGHGGMGTVLLGSRREADFVQRVAIKVLRGAGLGSRAAERLQDERRIIATLSHPHIAHFVDGGTTEEGRPYFAMEYVEGVPITRYCDGRELGNAARVRLFLKVCDAVRFAHSRLVVHRDIKPSNILVTADGTPKLLDFGIAKLMDPLQSPDSPTIGVLTPHYASPEQAAGAPVTTATDVYSLGVLLYELLTGVGPYRSVTTASPLGAVLDAIRREEPERPSVAAERAGRSVSEDLDAVLLKALRKDENDRYRSVDQLIYDLQRVLDGRPVLAHDGSRAYRLRRFVSRNRAVVAGATIAVASLVAAAGVSLWQAQVATRERALADARFNDVRALANAVVGPLYDSMAKVPGSTEARQVLVKEAVAYLDRLESQKSGDLVLKAELAAAYQKIGDVQGNMFGPNLGDVPGAKASYARLLSLRQAVFDANPGDVTARRDLANAHSRNADLAIGENRLDDAIAGYRKALAIIDGAPVADTSEEGLLARATMLNRQGVAQNWSDRKAEAIASFGQAIALVEPRASAAGASEAVQRSLLSAYGNLGDVFYHREQFDQALVHFEQSLAIANVLAATSKDAATAQRQVYLTTGRVASALFESGRIDEGIVRRHEAIAIQTEWTARDPRDMVAQFDLATDYQSLGVMMYAMERYAEARDALTKSRTIIETALAASPGQSSQIFEYAGTLAVLGMSESRLGRHQVAVDLLRKAVEMTGGEVSARKPSDHVEYQVELGDALDALAASTGSADARQQAREVWRVSLDGMRRLKADGQLPPSLEARLPDIERKLRQ